MPTGVGHSIRAHATLEISALMSRATYVAATATTAACSNAAADTAAPINPLAAQLLPSAFLSIGE